MKKPVTIGVIAVIVTILVTSAIDFSAIGAKPTNEVYAEGGTRFNGEIVCPDGSTKITNDIWFTLNFSEEEDGLKGQFSAQDLSQPQNRISSNLWAGEITSGKYLFKGVSSANEQISNLCGLSPFVVDELTVWGTCGDNVIVNFETEDGISGFSTGTVACV